MLDKIAGKDKKERRKRTSFRVYTYSVPKGESLAIIGKYRSKTGNSKRSLSHRHVQHHHSCSSIRWRRLGQLAEGKCRGCPVRVFFLSHLPFFFLSSHCRTTHMRSWKIKFKILRLLQGCKAVEKPCLTSPKLPRYSLYFYSDCIVETLVKPTSRSRRTEAEQSVILLENATRLWGQQRQKKEPRKLPRYDQFQRTKKILQNVNKQYQKKYIINTRKGKHNLLIPLQS